MKILIAPAILMLAASTARADQCEWVTPDVAEKAQQLLATHPNVISFCEPCGEQAPGLPTPAASVFVLRSRHVGASAEVSINDASVDLAYTYVQTSPTRYENLALLAGCEAEDVSPSLTVGDETKNGVLIVPSTEPAVQPIVPASASEDPLVESYLPRADRAATTVDRRRRNESQAAVARRGDRGSPRWLRELHRCAGPRDHAASAKARPAAASGRPATGVGSSCANGPRDPLSDAAPRGWLGAGDRRSRRRRHVRA